MKGLFVIPKHFLKNKYYCIFISQYSVFIHDYHEILYYNIASIVASLLATWHVLHLTIRICKVATLPYNIFCVQSHPQKQEYTVSYCNDQLLTVALILSQLHIPAYLLATQVTMHYSCSLFISPIRVFPKE